ncbi:MAG: hypothetical protein QOD96_6755 [Pseudonocardiales bacterium]|jgi:hypothetical protein|nr:hypothetical protein [Pseudonocardiales bacterium]
MIHLLPHDGDTMAQYQPPPHLQLINAGAEIRGGSTTPLRSWPDEPGR